MVGRFCYEMFQRRSEPCVDCPVKVVFETRKPFVMQRSVLLPDGSLKWGNVRNYPVLDDKGDVVYVLQIMIDITKIKTDSERHKKYVESLETTMREITTKNVPSLSKYGGKEVENDFTKRETEVLGLIANGYTNVEIGKILAISPHTVKSHAMNIFDKLGVKDRTQAAAWAARHELT
jgi:DNA-binding CsgD family transcriptional regulator